MSEHKENPLHEQIATCAKGLSLASHRLNLATFAASPNYDQRPASVPIDTLVIHAISLPPGKYGGDHIQAFFTNSLDVTAHAYFVPIKDLKVSAHLLIRRDGSMIQFVPFNLRAWHAGRSCLKGRSECNDFSIGIELEGCDEDKFEHQQYLSLAAVTAVLFDAYPDLDWSRVVGHSHIAPGRKTDPGPHFNWDLYKHLFEISQQTQRQAHHE